VVTPIKYIVGTGCRMILKAVGSCSINTPWEAIECSLYLVQLFT